MEELTAGQAAVLAHNEQAVDKATEDMEDLEEMLNESIADTLRGKKRRLEGEASLKSNKCASHARGINCEKMLS